MKNWMLFGITAIIVFVLAMLAYTIMDRKTEARFCLPTQSQTRRYRTQRFCLGIELSQATPILPKDRRHHL